MPYYDTIEEDLKRARKIEAKGIDYTAGGEYVALKLLESLADEVERLRTSRATLLDEIERLHVEVTELQLEVGKRD